jgi:hypothetical protein
VATGAAEGRLANAIALATDRSSAWLGNITALVPLETHSRLQQATPAASLPARRFPTRIVSRIYVLNVIRPNSVELKNRLAFESRCNAARPSAASRKTRPPGSWPSSPLLATGREFAAERPYAIAANRTADRDGNPPRDATDEQLRQRSQTQSLLRVARHPTTFADQLQMAFPTSLLRTASSLRSRSFR